MSNLESHDKTASGPVTATIMKENPSSRVARRTPGQNHGPITRLMSPSDFGRLLKPFVFLDLFETHGSPFTGFGLHPHSGIATLTYVAEGSVSYQDMNGATPANRDERGASSFGSPCRPNSSWEHRRASICHRR